MSRAKSEHTPGPWRTEETPTIHCLNARIVLAGSKGQPDEIIVARLWDRDEVNDEANAALIAAAPEMLKALRHSVDLIECLFEEMYDEPRQHPTLTQARAAIAAAEKGAK